MALVGFAPQRDLSHPSMFDSSVLGKQGLEDDNGESGGSDDNSGRGERNRGRDREWWLARVDSDDDSIDEEESSRALDNLRTPYDPKYDNITAWPFQNPDRVHMYFVHVGKAGGKSLYQHLHINTTPNRARCRMKAKRVNNINCYGKRTRRYRQMSMIAKRILGHIHVHNPMYKERVREWLRHRTNLLLVTVRDPIDRIRSAFNFHHNQFFQRHNKVRDGDYSRFGVTIFVDCFREVEDLALAVANVNATKHCHQIALAILDGTAKKGPLPHFKYNYKSYMNRVLSGRPKAVSVIRTENQWEDLATLESLLGGNSSRFLQPEKQVRYTHGSESFQLQAGLSPQGAKALCCALHGEVQIYHDLITSAVNLKGTEKAETLRSLFAHCGVNETLSNEQIWDWRWKSWYDKSCPDEMKNRHSIEVEDEGNDDDGSPLSDDAEKTGVTESDGGGGGDDDDSDLSVPKKTWSHRERRRL